MGTNYITAPVPDPDNDPGEWLGLILNARDDRMSLRAWVKAHNVRFRDGCIEKVRGWRNYALVDVADTAPITMVQRVKIHNGTARTIIGTKNYVYELTSAAALVKLNTVAFTGTDDTWWSMDQLAEIAYLTQVTDAPQKLTAGAAALATLGGSPPKAKWLQQFESHLVLGNLVVSGTVNPPYTAGSDIETRGGPEDWQFTVTTSDAELRLIPEGNDGVQRLMRIGNYLAVYKETSVHLYTYIGLPDVYAKQMVISFTGAMSGHAVVDIGNNTHLFVGQDNIYLFRGGLPTPIGDRIWTNLNQNGDAFQGLRGDIRADARGKIWSYDDPRLRETTIAYRSASSGDTDDKALLWNRGTDAYSTRDWPFRSAGLHNITANTNAWQDQSQAWSAWSMTWAEMLNSAIADLQTVAGTSAGLLCVVEEPGQDRAHSEDINAELISPDDCMGDATRWKILTGMWFDCPVITGNALDVYVGTRDDLTDAIVWNQNPYTVSASGRVDFTRTGRWFRYRFVKRGGRFVMREYARIFQWMGEY